MENQTQLTINDRDTNEKIELTNETRIEFSSTNPKREGTKIHGLWDTYSEATTIAELKELFGKGWKGVVKFDYPRGHMNIVE